MSLNNLQSLWPVSNGSSSCPISGTPITPNNTESRICGVQSDRAAAERCCESAEVYKYQCWLYCESTTPVGDWNQCIHDNATVGSSSAFCQSGSSSNATQSLKSFGFRSAAPRLSWMTLAFLATILLAGSAQATIVPSLDNGLAKRVSDGSCNLNIDRTYTSLQHGTKQVTAQHTSSCGMKIGCGFEFDILTSLNDNNRTLNGSSAAEPKFDAFFDAVSNSTRGHRFPALSSLAISHSLIIAQGTDFTIGWTPISFCVNGTVTGCSDTLDTAVDGTYFEACGPTYVDDDDESSPIQGLLQPIKH